MKNERSFHRFLLTVVLAALMLFAVIPAVRPGTHSASAAGMSTKTYRTLKLKGNWYETRHDGYRVKITRNKVVYYSQPGMEGYYQNIVKVKHINKRVNGYRYKGYMILLRNKLRMPMSNSYNMKNFLFIPDGSRGKEIYFYNNGWSFRSAVYIGGNSLSRVR